MDFSNPIDVVKLIGGILYCAVGGCTITVFIMSMIKNHWKFTKQAAFFLFGFMHVTVRAIYFFMPAAEFKKVMTWTPPWGNFAQVGLDLLPETLFFLSFLLLITTWFQLYLRSHQSSRFVHKQYLWTNVVCMSLVVASALVIIFLAFTGWDYNLLFILEARWNAVIAGLLLISFIVIGLVARKKLSHSASLSQSPFIRGQTLKVGWTTGIVVTALVLRAVYINILNQVIRSLRLQKIVSEFAFAIIYLCYFLLTEIIPVALVQVITVLTFGVKKRRSSSAEMLPHRPVPGAGPTSITTNPLQHSPGRTPSVTTVPDPSESPPPTLALARQRAAAQRQQQRIAAQLGFDPLEEKEPG